jgi:four helix bundle protein
MRGGKIENYELENYELRMKKAVLAQKLQRIMHSINPSNPSNSKEDLVKERNIVLEKSFAFAVRAVHVSRFLMAHKSEYVLSRQLLRCSTSIGANLEEAVGGQSRADFYAKLTVAYKETRESSYWIRLLRETGYLNHNESSSLLTDVNELLKIIGAIQIGTKNPSRNS